MSVQTLACQVVTRITFNGQGYRVRVLCLCDEPPRVLLNTLTATEAQGRKVARQVGRRHKWGRD